MFLADNDCFKFRVFLFFPIQFLLQTFGSLLQLNNCRSVIMLKRKMVKSRDFNLKSFVVAVSKGEIIEFEFGLNDIKRYFRDRMASAWVKFVLEISVDDELGVWVFEVECDWLFAMSGGFLFGFELLFIVEHD